MSRPHDLSLLVLVPMVLILAVQGGCKDTSDTANKARAAKSATTSKKAKKGFVGYEPQVLFDAKSGKTTPLKWEFDGTIVGFKIDSSYGQVNQVDAVINGKQEWVHVSCPLKIGGSGRIELMIRDRFEPHLRQVLHALCISGEKVMTTRATRHYLVRGSEGPEFGGLTGYEHEGEYYQPIEKHPDALKLQTLFAGDNHSCGIRKDGSAVCWGDHVMEHSVAPTTGRFTMIDVNVLRSCGIMVDKSIACWGRGTNIGEEPTPPPKGSFVDIAVGHSQMCAIDTHGKSSCWWTGEPKQVKKDTNADKILSFSLNQGSITPPEDEFVNLEAAYAITCGLTKDGEIKCWGSDLDGLVSAVPTGKFSQFALDASDACALRIDGTLACWGDFTDDGFLPPKGTFKQVDVGGYFACAVDTDAHIQCWGPQPAKELAPPEGEFRFVSAGDEFACGIHTDDTVVCWSTRGDDVDSPPEKTWVPLF